jgi:type IV secretory pathway TrbL component
MERNQERGLEPQEARHEHYSGSLSSTLGTSAASRKSGGILSALMGGTAPKPVKVARKDTRKLKPGSPKSIAAAREAAGLPSGEKKKGKKARSHERHRRFRRARDW